MDATYGMDEVYGLAADMGGMGFISNHHSQILYNNAMINFNTLDASKDNKVKRYFYTSSACIYPEYKQKIANVVPLKEEDAYPAQPQDAYGWEKLIMERLCMHYYEDYGIETRIVRFHNIYGPYGTWEDGREKAPAALCRKIAYSKLIPALKKSREIEVWGDGLQTRSFCYIDDCVEGIYRLMQSDYRKPLNLGSDRMVSINELAMIIAHIARISNTIELKHIEGPMGVRGRNSDNTKLREVLGWEPRTTLEAGLEHTYGWIEGRVYDKIWEEKHYTEMDNPENWSNIDNEGAK
jgi:nucleoside-diphosphate-sugar epimerase